MGFYFPRKIIILKIKSKQNSKCSNTKQTLQVKAHEKQPSCYRLPGLELILFLRSNAAGTTISATSSIECLPLPTTIELTSEHWIKNGQSLYKFAPINVMAQNCLFLLLLSMWRILRNSEKQTGKSIVGHNVIWVIRFIWKLFLIRFGLANETMGGMCMVLVMRLAGHYLSWWDTKDQLLCIGTG